MHPVVQEFGLDATTPKELSLGAATDPSCSEATRVHITKTDSPPRSVFRRATARQSTDFGDAAGYGTIAAEYFSLGAGNRNVRMCRLLNTRQRQSFTDTGASC
jgi:hypothetical protein